MQGFLNFLTLEQVESDLELVCDYISENFDYEDEEEFEEILNSLDEEDIEYILDEGFADADLGGYKPSGNQKGASQATPAPRVTVRKPGKPARRVQTQSSGSDERKPGQAPKGNKPSAPQKAEQEPAKEQERKAPKPQGRRLQKTSDPSTMPKEEPKKEAPSSSSDKPKRGTFKTSRRGKLVGSSKKVAVRTGGSDKAVVSSGKKSDAQKRSTPEAKERAKKVKRYLKKGTSAKKVAQYVKREKKRLAPKADKSTAVRKPKAQSSTPTEPKKPKAQVQATPQKADKPKAPATQKPSPEATKRAHQEPEERGSEGDKAAAERRRKLRTALNDKLLNARVNKKKRGTFKTTAKKAGTTSGRGLKPKAGDSIEASSKERVKSYVSQQNGETKKPKKVEPKKTEKKATGFGPSRTAPKIDKVKKSSGSKQAPKKSLKDFIKSGVSKAKSKLKRAARGALLKMARKMKEDYDTCEFLALMLIEEGYVEDIFEAIYLIEEIGMEPFQEILSE